MEQLLPPSDDELKRRKGQQNFASRYEPVVTEANALFGQTRPGLWRRMITALLSGFHKKQGIPPENSPFPPPPNPDLK